MSATKEEMRRVLIGDAHLTAKMAAALAYLDQEKGRTSLGRKFATMATLRALETRGLVELEPNMVELSPKGGELLALAELIAYRRPTPQGMSAERARLKALALAPFPEA